MQETISQLEVARGGTDTRVCTHNRTVSVCSQVYCEMCNSFTVVYYCLCRSVCRTATVSVTYFDDSQEWVSGWSGFPGRRGADRTKWCSHGI